MAGKLVLKTSTNPTETSDDAARAERQTTSLAPPTSMSGPVHSSQHRAEAAYANLLPEIQALADDELIPINIDVPTAVTTVLGSLPEIRALRQELDDALRRFDFERFDRLEEYALALYQAHVLWRIASVPKATITALADELSRARDMLLLQTTALAAHGLIDGDRLKDCKKLTGYKPVASDVATIVEVLRHCWPALENKTPLTLAQLDELATKAVHLLAAIGLKEQAPRTTGGAALIRQKAFTVFVRSYEETRQAVLFVRSKAGDADSIAPSLYAGRTKRSSGTSKAGKAPRTSDPVGVPAGTRNAPLVIDNPHGSPLTPPLVD